MSPRETPMRRTCPSRSMAMAFAGISLCVAIGGVVLSAPQSHAQGSAPAASTVSAAGITLHSVHAEFPSADRMFAGSGADVVNANCTACHSPGMVLVQPPLSRAAWQEEVAKMRSAYKAPVEDADIPAIVDYLVAHQGTK
jgi:cytochrome c5